MENNETPAVVENGEQGKPVQKDRILPISILIAAVMIAGALVFATLYKGSPSSNGGNGVNGNGVAATSTQLTPLPALGSRDAILGSANAPVTVVEYGDYQCPFCGDYFEKLEPQIKSQYIDSGKVKMVFRDYPFLGPESESAAEAAQCAEDQNALWAYHDALYSAKIGDVAKGGSENDGFFTRTVFMNIAAQLKLNTTTFANCIDNSSDASIVAQEKSAATAAGVDSTPATFVNGKLVADTTGQNVGDNQPAVLAAIQAAVAAAK